jgi:signal transduction histidine kinase
VAVIDDVSERRRLEAVRRDFVANISHELKTPVGALGLLAETIAAEPDGAVTHRLAQRMTGEAFRVARLIDDLLDLTSIEAEETAVHEPVAVHAVVTEATNRVRPLAESREITVDVRGVARRHTLRADRRQLVSAVGNLLENACKYSDLGSSVEVSSKARPAGSRSPCRTTGSASRRATSNGSSSASTGWTAPAAGGPAGRASASPSSATSRPTTAARSGCDPVRARARRSPCGCRRAPAPSRHCPRRPR